MQRETERHLHRCVAKKREIPIVEVVDTVVGEMVKMKGIVVVPAVEVQDAVVVDPTRDLNHVLPGAVNAPHAANEAVNEAARVIVIPGKKGNARKLVHPLGHAHNHLPHDQHHGRVPAHQQQSSVIKKKKNRVVDIVAQPAPTDSFYTEEYCFFPML